MKQLKTFAYVIAAAVAVGCSSVDDSKNTTPGYKDVLTALSVDVITETYKDLNQKAIALKNSVDAFIANSSDANLQAMRKAWVDTRKPWEQSEGFLYGPVDTEGLDPALDTWPVDVNAMNDIINSNQNITAALIAANNEARGFHLIEFLIWGENGNKQANEITARQKEYLLAAAVDLQLNTQKLYDGWKASGGNFAQHFITAGVGSVLYPSQKAALEEIVEGLVTIADEVGAGKIEDPLNSEGGVPKPELEESRFSNNSKADFADNMRSIQNIYLGKYGQKDVLGLEHLLIVTNPTLDTKIKTAINEAIAAIEAIPGTFTQAISNNRPAVIQAQEKVTELQEILESELKPFINSLP
ncbi:imelysin family protein [Capnocytophaga sp. ARDL2]|uniref:imelysin family protein n=1 Tax=Capnocytophaga sp. ARDL2 TaxID=3238809 RepID=UPI0035572CA8